LEALVAVRHKDVFPFAAVVGQETLKTALLLNAVDPRIGGVLVRGEKGTAKSTAVRGLAALLPEIDVVEGCRFGCDPDGRSSWCPECTASDRETMTTSRRRPTFVDLPISATEDRLVGTLDLEHALRKGERRFEPGLLADANRGILYVDEVNLLDDHLVDTLLDAAAMGVNVVEREGIAFSHPARFMLVGTMNPEEGEVRPQLLDRFGMCVEVQGLSRATDRVHVITRRTEFEDDPIGFRATWSQAERDVRDSLVAAQRGLPAVEVPHDLLFLIASICAEMRVDGHRADIVMTRAATALAALEQATEVTPGHVRKVAPLVLAHRMRRKPFEDTVFDETRLDAIVGNVASRTTSEDESSASGGDEGQAGESDDVLRTMVSVAAGEGEAADEAPTRLAVHLDRIRRTDSGRRQETRADDNRGRYVRSEPLRAGQQPDIALDATIRAAAPFQVSRQGDMAVKIERGDIQNKVRKRRVGASIVFCVDASGSMGASMRMEATKAAILDLLVDAYQRRDRVGLVTFRGDTAELLLSPTASVELAQLKLRDLATGGATPLAHGISRSLDVLATETRRNETAVPWLVLVTDGRANVGLNGGLGSEDARTCAQRVKAARINAMVIDTDSAATRASAARELARLAGGEYVRLGSMDGTSVATAVRERVGAAQ
jgi:magnesium chelatase subunit D